MNKKIEIKLAGKKYQLWFNNYAVIELQKMYDIQDVSDTMTKVMNRANENYLLLLSDLIVVGIKGYCFAKSETTPDILSNINEVVAEAEMTELMSVWGAFFDSMGGNIKPDADKKKEPKTKKNTSEKVIS